MKIVVKRLKFVIVMRTGSDTFRSTRDQCSTSCLMFSIIGPCVLDSVYLNLAGAVIILASVYLNLVGVFVILDSVYLNMAGVL